MSYRSEILLCNSWPQNRWITYETKYFKCNSFQVISDLLNSDNLKVAITQLRHELQVWNFYDVIADPKVGEQHI